MRAKHVLTHYRTVTDTPPAYDSEGNLLGATTVAQPIKAYSIGPRYSNAVDGLVTVGLVVGLPNSYGIESGDRVDFEGKSFTVEGELINSNLGPGSYKPGFVMHLKRGYGR